MPSLAAPQLEALQVLADGQPHTTDVHTRAGRVAGGVANALLRKGLATDTAPAGARKVLVITDAGCLALAGTMVPKR